MIAPYTAQVRLITQHLLTDSVRQERFTDLLGTERAKELENIEVKTVDGFEGREKDVMLCSMVRCNPGGWVGFLGDWRRLNVALTRARKVRPSPPPPLPHLHRHPLLFLSILHLRPLWAYNFTASCPQQKRRGGGRGIKSEADIDRHS